MIRPKQIQTRSFLSLLVLGSILSCADAPKLSPKSTRSTDNAQPDTLNPTPIPDSNNQDGDSSKDEITTPIVPGTTPSESDPKDTGKPGIDAAATQAVLKLSQSFTYLDKNPPNSVKDDFPSKVCIYPANNYGGTALCAGEGAVVNLASGKKALSLKIASDMWIELFDQADGKGNSFAASESVARLDSMNFDEAKSYRIYKRSISEKFVSVESGKLKYKVLAEGDKVMDFSTAGYAGGGVKRPLVKVVTTLATPPSGDATATIQAAIAALGKTAVDSEGFRGSIKLGPGDWKLAGTVHLNVSGVVLQGSVEGTKKTRLIGTGNPHLLLDASGSDRSNFDTKVDIKQSLAEKTVAVGSWTLPLKSVVGLKKDDSILLEVPVSAEWIKLLSMDKLVRDGAAQTWMKPGALLTMDRRITAIEGNNITLDSPIPHTIRPEYTASEGGAYVRTYRQAGRLHRVGIEDLEAQGEFVGGSISTGLWQFLDMENIEDAWVNNLKLTDFGAGSIKLANSARRITVANVFASVSEAQDNSAGYAAIFTIMGSQILLRDCSASSPAKIFYVVTQTATMGPNVILNLHDVGKSIGFIQPHARWAAGLLVDNAVLLGGGTQFIDRATAGSGHGWSVGHSVAWNSIGESFDVMSPPKAGNFSVGMIGSTSKQLADHSKGYADSLGALYKDIPSLYLMQLVERKGLDSLEW